MSHGHSTEDHLSLEAALLRFLSLSFLLLPDFLLLQAIHLLSRCLLLGFFLSTLGINFALLVFRQVILFNLLFFSYDRFELGEAAGFGTLDFLDLLALRVHCYFNNRFGLLFCGGLNAFCCCVLSLLSLCRRLRGLFCLFLRSLALVFLCLFF